VPRLLDSTQGSRTVSGVCHVCFVSGGNVPGDVGGPVVNTWRVVLSSQFVSPVENVGYCASFKIREGWGRIQRDD